MKIARVHNSRYPWLHTNNLHVCVYHIIIVSDLAHYAVYGMSAYSLYMLMFVKPCTGLCGVCARCLCGAECIRSPK